MLPSSTTWFLILWCCSLTVSCMRLSDYTMQKIRKGFAGTGCLIIIGDKHRVGIKPDIPAYKISVGGSEQVIRQHFCSNVITMTTDIPKLETVLTKLFKAKALLSNDPMIMVGKGAKAFGKSIPKMFTKIMIIGEARLRKYGIWMQQLRSLDGDVTFTPQKESADLISLFKNTMSTLKGSFLKVGTFHFPPSIIFLAKTKEYTGIDMEIVKLFAHALGLRSTVVEPADGQMWGSLTNDSSDYTGNTGMVVRGEVNIGIANYFVMESYMRWCDFIYPHDLDRLGTLVPPATAVPKWRAVVNPFNATVWISTSILFIFSFLIIVFKAKLYKAIFARPVGSLDSSSYAALYNLQAITGIVGVDDDSQWPLKVYIVLMWTTYFFLTISYRASLVAHLSAPLFEDPINTFKELANTDLEVVSTSDDFGRSMKEASDLYLNRLAKRYRVSNDVDGNIAEVNNKKVAYMEATESLGLIAATQFTDRYGKPRLHIMQDYLKSFNIAAFVPKNSPLKSRFDIESVRITQAGLVTYWKIRSMETSKLLSGVRKTGNSDQNKNTAFSVQDLQGSFYLFIFGIFVAIIGFAAEVISSFKGKKSERRTG